MRNLLQTKLLAAFPDAYVAGHTASDWSSIHFKGERHQITLAFEDELRHVQCVLKLRDENYDIDLDMGPKTLVSRPEVTEISPVNDLFFVTVEIVTLND